MKRFFVSGLVLILMLSGCGKSPKLKKDTPAYRFAKEVAAKLPYLDPDKNNVLVSSKKFKITTGEALNEIFLSSGKRSSQFLAMNPEQIKFYVEQTAMNLGEKRILMDQVKKMNIDVTPVQVDSVVNDYVNQVGGQEKFNKSLNDMGITLNLIKRDFHDQLAIDRVFTHRFAEDIRVTEQEIQQAHEQGSVATVRHILLLTQGKGDSTRKEQYRKMLAIQQRIRRGEDFAVLANRYSEDPGSNKKGGLVENFKRGDMVPAFDEAAFSIPINGVSDVIETEYGYHIMKVINRKKDNKPLNAALRAEIQKQIEQRKRNELLPKIQAYMDQLKQEYGVSISKF